MLLPLWICRRGAFAPDGRGSHPPWLFSFAVGAPSRPTVGEVTPRGCFLCRRGAFAPDGRGSHPPWLFSFAGGAPPRPTVGEVTPVLFFPVDVQPDLLVPLEDRHIPFGRCDDGGLAGGRRPELLRQIHPD